MYEDQRSTSDDASQEISNFFYETRSLIGLGLSKQARLAIQRVPESTFFNTPSSGVTNTPSCLAFASVLGADGVKLRSLCLLDKYSTYGVTASPFGLSLHGHSIHVGTCPLPILGGMLEGMQECRDAGREAVVGCALSSWVCIGRLRKDGPHY